MRSYKTLPFFALIMLLLATGWPYAATYTVTNLNDSGSGSLRWAIEQANANPGEDTINFSIYGTISPASVLPELTDDDTIIDASSQWLGTWPNGQPGIELNGSDGSITYGLQVSGTSNCHIRGLFITGFEQDGIIIRDGSQSNTVGGTDTGYRNVVSGNKGNGVEITGTETANNTISGNYIGPNQWHGIVIHDGAHLNTIGGSTASDRNVISSNWHGVYIYGSGTDQNVVSGNYIGTDVTGTADRGNPIDGVCIEDQARLNIIGGTTEGERNIISGNGSRGIMINHDSDQNVVSGNYIGTDVTGTAALANGTGVYIGHESQANTVGGNTEGERNIISGNGSIGVFIAGTAANNNMVSGNYIGTDVTGTAGLGNGFDGVHVKNGAELNTIGGNTESERNIISGNDGTGVEIFNTDNNVVSGNYIGTDVTGTADLGNADYGVYIWYEAQSHNITANRIIFNNDSGIQIDGENTLYNKLSRNSIYNNTGMGIDLEDGGNDEVLPPVIILANIMGSTLAISGVRAGADATVEIFQADSQASGEGMVYMGSLTANGGGDFSGNMDVSGSGLSIGHYIVTTTTHTDNNTSEFSIPVPVTQPSFIVQAFCPVDLKVIDPEGKIINRDSSTIPLATYAEEDLNDDGDPDDIVSIPGALPGDYIIEVIPEPGANPTDTYTLEINHNGEITRLAEDVAVQDIPTELYEYYVPCGCECQLAVGWNMFSFSVNKCFYVGTEPPANQPAYVEMVHVIDDLGFASLADWFESVITPVNPMDNPWSLVIGTEGVMDSDLPPSSHSLKYMSVCSGYWVKMKDISGGASIAIDGALFDPDCGIPMVTGWSIASYPLNVGYYDTDDPPSEVTGVTNWVKVPRPVAAHVFASIAGKYWLIISTHGVYDPSLSPTSSSLRYIAPCDAFWVKMTEPWDLVYSAMGTAIGHHSNRYYHITIGTPKWP